VLQPLPVRPDGLAHFIEAVTAATAGHNIGGRAVDGEAAVLVRT
jgi:hypothetical protein